MFQRYNPTASRSTAPQPESTPSGGAADASDDGAPPAPLPPIPSFVMPALPPLPTSILQRLARGEVAGSCALFLYRGAADDGEPGAAAPLFRPDHCRVTDRWRPPSVAPTSPDGHSDYIVPAAGLYYATYRLRSRFGGAAYLDGEILPGSATDHGLGNEAVTFLFRASPGQRLSVRATSLTEVAEASFVAFRLTE